MKYLFSSDFDEAVKVTLQCFKNLMLLFPNWFLLRKSLKPKNVTKLRPYKVALWHHGFFYFKGELYDKSIFIKVDKKLHFLKNEYIAYKLLKDEMKLIPLLDFVEDDLIQIAIFEFITGRCLTKNEIVIDKEISEEIHKALMALSNNGVFHRDIKLDNFIKQGEVLYLIDFTFSVGSSKCPVSFKKLNKKVKLELDILNELGKTNRPGDLIWNDFYSMSVIMDDARSYSSASNGCPDYTSTFKRHSRNKSMTYDLIND